MIPPLLNYSPLNLICSTFPISRTSMLFVYLRIEKECIKRFIGRRAFKKTWLLISDSAYLCDVALDFHSNGQGQRNTDPACEFSVSLVICASYSACRLHADTVPFKLHGMNAATKTAVDIRLKPLLTFLSLSLSSGFAASPDSQTLSPVVNKRWENTNKLTACTTDRFRCVCYTEVHPGRFRGQWTLQWPLNI